MESTGTFAEAVRSAVSSGPLAGHLREFSELFRDSGTEDEWEAARYIKSQMDSFGIDCEILSFESLISLPGPGTLEVLDSEGEAAQAFHVRTRSFGAQTPEGGVVAELAHVPFEQPEQGAMIFSHRAVQGDYSGVDVAGKIVLTMDGGPDGVRRAEERGAAGHIHIWPSDEQVVHEMIATSVWGTPTPESAKNIPGIPALGLNNADGGKLAELCAGGTVRVRMESNVDTGWRNLPLAVANVRPGADDASERFLLVGAHIDSWYEGVTDNATGDAALIEMARTLQKHRDGLRYGVRFCWWPGHSTGRYSGSTWYVDTHFMELRRNCLGYLNIDSPGVRETEIWDCRYNMGEIEHITGSVVEELSGQEPNIRRPLKAGDQSFLGVGLPSLGAFRMLPVDHPDRKAVGGCGGAYWWHSPEDTLDKADPEILADDCRIYVTIVARMCCPEVHPYNFVPSADDFINQLGALQEVAGQHLDLSGPLEAARRYRAAAERVSGATVEDVEAHNQRLLAVTRIINPALFTIDGPYEFDPALQLPILPGLAPMQALAGLDPSSDDYRFLWTSLIRQRNRIHDALMQAVQVLEGMS
ncbi:M28 family peptidase [soil metagenome]